MKTIRKYRFLLVAVMLPMLCFSQEQNEAQTKDNFEDYAYMSKIDSFDELLENGDSVETIYKKLGNSNFLNANYDVAVFWYSKLFQLEDIKVASDYFYRYAQSLKSTKNYKESNIWMQKFKAAKNHDKRANLYANNQDYLKNISIPSEQYTIKNLTKLNTKESEFAPSYYLNNLVFSTSRDLETPAKHNNLPYLNLYNAKLKNEEIEKLSKFSEVLNSTANESSTCFSKDGKTVYFTRNNYSKKAFKRDKSGISRLKIYRATFINGEWTNIEDLPFNNTDYSVAHPTLNSSETKLYFASDMPGSLGASDIYVVDVLADGTFGIPINLGTPINTEGKETFPFIGKSGTLYFASDGHPGLGGLDLFSVDLNKKQTVTNLGSPLNSSEDDFSIILDEKEEKGYFASNRNGGIGNDDIYTLTKSTSDCFTFIEGIAIDKDSEKPLPNTTINAYDFLGNKLANTGTLSDGTYTIRIPCQEKQYKLSGVKDNYEDGALFMLTSTEEKNIKNTRIELEMSSKVADVGSDLVKILKLTPIYFDLNSSYLRKDALPELDKVVEYMQKRPEIIIEVGSHTDSREEDKYNLWLSERRAKSTITYIISKGIDNNRISGKGYGETQLINNCKNGVPCSNKDHQLNRRSEFIVIEK